MDVSPGRKLSRNETHDLSIGSLAPVEEAMQALNFHDIEKKLESERGGRDMRMQRLSYGLE